MVRGSPWRKVIEEEADASGVYVYCVCYLEKRNSRVFGGEPMSTDVLYRRIVSIVHHRGCSWRGLKRTKANWDMCLE
ncbi:hypothetical protein LIER_21821 [Lithospermum erythrorhizon]|uniref:Uncharacterized protein n=1 Tax=Lithospermum erythrorhizon TaxID=34254 RepID=A0AAV3QUP8_LITER